jgi:hypothetical protein
MGKLHTLRRVIERDPAKWQRFVPSGEVYKDGEWKPFWRKRGACGAFMDSDGEWKPLRWGCRPWFSNVGSYRKFVEHVLRTLNQG